MAPKTSGTSKNVSGNTGDNLGGSKKSGGGPPKKPDGDPPKKSSKPTSKPKGAPKPASDADNSSNTSGNGRKALSTSGKDTKRSDQGGNNALSSTVTGFGGQLAAAVPTGRHVLPPSGTILPSRNIDPLNASFVRPVRPDGKRSEASGTVARPVRHAATGSKSAASTEPRNTTTVIQSSSRLAPSANPSKGKGPAKDVQAVGYADTRGGARRDSGNRAKRDGGAAGELSAHDDAVSGGEIGEAGLGGCFPREIRDQIYSYLLDHRKIRYTPFPRQPKTIAELESWRTHSKAYDRLGSTAHTYNFCTELMHTDPDTAREATEYLHKHNTFILVEWSAPLFETALHLYNVPIVTDRGLRCCRVHALYVMLEWRNAPIVIIQRLAATPDNCKDGSALMLLEDFDKLCGLLKFLCQYSLPAGIYVSTGRGVDFAFRERRRTDMLDMHVSVTRPVLDPGLRDAFIETAKTATGAGYKLTIDGFCYTDSQTRNLVNSMAERMAPPLIWTRALLWDQFDTALQMKASADSLAKAGYFVEPSIDICSWQTRESPCD